MAVVATAAENEIGSLTPTGRNEDICSGQRRGHSWGRQYNITNVRNTRTDITARKYTSGRAPDGDRTRHATNNSAAPAPPPVAMQLSENSPGIGIGGRGNFSFGLARLRNGRDREEMGIKRPRFVRSRTSARRAGRRGGRHQRAAWPVSLSQSSSEVNVISPTGQLAPRVRPDTSLGQRGDGERRAQDPSLIPISLISTDSPADV
ncbi:hypothetical protein EVAR_3406_1 [Eumeta japonica]|uniref:Uncharacterized protein n=1 Tax=Eumeta variegata TaxID=151549 RepID=A0A4C1SSC3_EUMVA|nr:hypothetical protein EVAR_3406_1 [Eumeta japonica]